MDENITQMITPDAPQEIPATQPVAVEEPAQEQTVPVYQIPEEPAPQPQDETTPPKAKKKLGKKAIIIGIAAILVVALVVGLVSLLGSGTKNTGVFLKDGELYLYTDGMKEPMELTSRLWKAADGNKELASMGARFITQVFIRNNGQLVFYPDKFDSGADGYTIFVKNVNKPKEDPVKIDSDITWFDVTEDGEQMLYIKDQQLYLYHVKNDEETRLAKDVANYFRLAYAEDFSSICYLSDEDLYLWTPKTEDVKIAKGVSVFHYAPETGMVFAKTADGELLMKTAEMEECEEVAEDVSTLLASYPTGEAYFLRVVETERCLLDYLDDDMKAEDSVMVQPKKPNYPTAPQRVYYWSYATEEEYEEAKKQYDLDYAAYQEQYNALKEEYNNAMALYNLKLERDDIRDSLKDRVMEREEYVLYYFDGSEEHLLADSLVENSFKDRASDVPVLVYHAYTPAELVKPKLSEIEGKWTAANLVQQAIKDALYTESEYYLLQGGNASVIDQTSASNFIVTNDGSAVYFLDAPFVAYSSKNSSRGDAPATEAPAAEAPAAEAPAATEPAEEEEMLIPVNQREYAALYRITISDGKGSAPELVDSDVSIHHHPYIGKDASRLTCFKNVDEEDYCGELYVGGQLIHDEAFLNTYIFLENSILFFTDWDDEDDCGTLCVMKLGDENGEVIEIADDVRMFTVTENEDLLYLQDYSTKRYEGTLFLYDMSKGKAKEIADEVIFLGSHN